MISSAASVHAVAEVVGAGDWLEDLERWQVCFLRSE